MRVYLKYLSTLLIIFLIYHCVVFLEILQKSAHEYCFNNHRTIFLSKLLARKY